MIRTKCPPARFLRGMAGILKKEPVLERFRILVYFSSNIIHLQPSSRSYAKDGFRHLRKGTCALKLTAPLRAGRRCDGCTVIATPNVSPAATYERGKARPNSAERMQPAHACTFHSSRQPAEAPGTSVFPQKIKKFKKRKVYIMTTIQKNPCKNQGLIKRAHEELHSQVGRDGYDNPSRFRRKCNLHFSRLH